MNDNYDKSTIHFTPLAESYFTLPGKKSEQDNSLKTLVSLDLLIHNVLLVFSILFIVGYTMFVTQQQKQEVKNKQKDLSLSPSIKKVMAQPSESSSDEKGNSIFINQQEIQVDKSLFSLSPSYKLTLNGPMNKEIFGFFPYWMIANAETIDIRTITSLSFFGLEVDSQGELVKEAHGSPNNPYSIWQSSVELKQFFERVRRNKTKLNLTFKSFNNDTIEKLISSAASSEQFIKTILYQVNTRSLDGVTIDFEYYGTPREEIRNKFSLLMDTLNKELKKQNPQTTLSICVYASAATVDQLWDIPYLANHSDAIIVMGYDFFTPHSSSAGPVAPLSGYGSSLSGMIADFLDKAPAEKIVLAVPYYGYSWPTENLGKNAPVRLGGEVNVLSYAETKKLPITDAIWDENSQTPWYAYLDINGKPHVLHFENVRSLSVKYDFVNKKNLAGVGVWAMGFEGNDPELTQLQIDKFSP